MQSTTITVMMIFGVLCGGQARPQPPPPFVFWNFFPFLQQQQLHHMQMMQQAQMQFPSFEMYFNGPFPIAHSQPIFEEDQFKVQPTPPPTSTSTPSTTTTSTTTPQPTTPKPTTRPTTRQPTTRTTTPKPTTRTTTPRATAVAPVSGTFKTQISNGIFEMARRIQANILSRKTQQNGKFNVFSPINVAAVLSLLELGAKGQTNLELQQILGFDKLPSSKTPLHRHHALGQMLESLLHPKTSSVEKGAQISMANGIFMQTGYSMHQDYRTSVETIYQSQVTALEFQQRPAVATKFINDWVRQKTNGKIVNILEDGIDKTARMMVASAVYFKALWQSSFLDGATSKRAFYPNGREGQKILVDTMANAGEFNFYDSKELDCGILALPFKGQTATMYVILPNKSNAARLRLLQRALTADVIEEMIAKMELHSAIVTLPRMHFSDTLDLKEVLGDLKVRKAFDGARSDFGGITEHKMSLDGFVHKIDLTINESGTEAAAATASHLSRQDFQVEFRVDSPFMFFVRHDETRLPIFYGAVMEPVMET